MISEATFKQFQTKTMNFVSGVAKKAWENKLIVVPAVIVGCGLIKNRSSLKTNKKATQQQQVDLIEEEQTRTEYLKQRKQLKRRIYVSNMSLHSKLAKSMSFKEESLNLEDASTSCHSDKESVHVKFLLVDTKNTESGSGYYSDVESIAQEREKSRKKKVSTTRRSSNPDDLFFNIFQQLK